MKAIILAGGRGTRLMPLTNTMPKPMLQVKGRSLLEWQMGLLKKHGITDVIVCGHYMFDKIKNHLGNGKRFGTKITYFFEESPLGTGGAMKNAESAVTDTVLIVYGDIFTSIDIEKLVDFHRKKKADATIVLHESDHPQDSDAVEIDAESRITKILGRGTDVRLTKSSIYVLEPAVFRYMKRKCSFEDEVLSIIIKSCRVFGYVTDEPIKDVGTINRYEAMK